MLDGQVVHNEEFILLASSAPQHARTHIPGVPAVASQTFHLVCICPSAPLQYGSLTCCVLKCDTSCCSSHLCQHTPLSRLSHEWTGLQRGKTQQGYHSGCQGFLAAICVLVGVLKATFPCQVRVRTGELCDQYVIADDFVHLSHNSGACLYDDLLAILAVRPEANEISVLSNLLIRGEALPRGDSRGWLVWGLGYAWANDMASNVFKYAKRLAKLPAVCGHNLI